MESQILSDIHGVTQSYHAKLREYLVQSERSDRGTPSCWCLWGYSGLQFVCQNLLVEGKVVLTMDTESTYSTASPHSVGL